MPSVEAESLGKWIPLPSASQLAKIKTRFNFHCRLRLKQNRHDHLFIKFIIGLASGPVSAGE